MFTVWFNWSELYTQLYPPPPLIYGGSLESGHICSPRLTKEKKRKRKQAKESRLWMLQKESSMKRKTSESLSVCVCFFDKHGSFSSDDRVFQNYTTTQGLTVCLEAPHQFGIVIKAGSNCFQTEVNVFPPCNIYFCSASLLALFFSCFQC